MRTSQSSAGPACQPAISFDFRRLVFPLPSVVYSSYSTASSDFRWLERALMKTCPACAERIPNDDIVIAGISRGGVGSPESDGGRAGQVGALQAPLESQCRHPVRIDCQRERSGGVDRAGWRDQRRIGQQRTAIAQLSFSSAEWSEMSSFAPRKNVLHRRLSLRERTSFRGAKGDPPRPA